MANPNPPEPTTPSNPNPPSPPAPPTEDPVIKLQDEVIKETNRKLKEAEAELARFRATPAPTTPTAPRDPQEFFADPFGSIDALISKRMEESVGPLNEMAKRNARAAEYARIKGLIKNHPSVAPFWNLIEADLDSMEANYKGEVTLEIVGQSVRGLIGNYAVSNPKDYARIVSGESPVPPTPPQNPPTPPKAPVIPPQLPPSAPALPPSTSGDPKPRELTEAERRLARERWGSLGDEEAFKKYRELLGEGSFVLDPTKKPSKA